MKLNIYQPQKWISFSYLLLISLIVIAFACKKEDDDTVGPPIVEEPIELAAVSGIQVEDTGDAGNGGDLEISFSNVSDESDVAEYRIIVLKSSKADAFTLANAEQLAAANYTAITPAGGPIVTALETSARDTDGDLIVNDVPYKVLVLTYGNQNQDIINALSSPSPEITLTGPPPNPTTVDITYIANDGVMIDDGEHKVIIDGIVPFGNLGGWIRPSSTALQNVLNAQAPYDNIDVIMITHAHGDHYGIQAVQTYLANNPTTKIVAPAQVLNGLSINAQQQVLLTPPQFSSERQTINGVDIEVLHLKHFNQFGNIFCNNTTNYGYLVRMGGLEIVHMGDVDIPKAQLGDFDLLDQGIDVALIPTFGTLVTTAQRDSLMTHMCPANIIALHLQSGNIPGIKLQVAANYPEAVVFDSPFQVQSY